MAWRRFNQHYDSWQVDEARRQIARAKAETRKMEQLKKEMKLSSKPKEAAVYCTICSKQHAGGAASCTHTKASSARSAVGSILQWLAPR